MATPSFFAAKIGTLANPSGMAQLLGSSGQRDADGCLAELARLVGELRVES
jgi:hypothetical protein